MNSKQTILDILGKAFSDAGFKLEQDIHIEHPQDMSHGDWACTSALGYAKKNGLNPSDVAKKVMDKIITEKEYFGSAPEWNMYWVRSSEDDLVSKVDVGGGSGNTVEIAGPGFINLTLGKKYWIDQLASTQNNEWGTSELLAGQNWLVEHTSLNLFKPFGIGHLVNNSYGTAITQILKSAGATVIEASFPSDISPGIAKGVWALKQEGWIENMNIEKIGEAYRLGVIAYKEDEQAKVEIDDINRILYHREAGEYLDIYTKGQNISMEYFQVVLDRLGTKHDTHFYESLTAGPGKELVEANTPGIFIKSQGAYVFEGSKHGLFDNVFVNSAGFSTYLAKDLGLVKLKNEKYPQMDVLLTIADTEQKQHFELVHKSIELILPEIASRVKYIQHGRLRLTTGKISSRNGGVPIAEDLLEGVQIRTAQMSKDAGKDLSINDTEIIAQGALRYSFLKTSMGKNIVFDLEKSLSFEGDSGPYIQYTYVRAKSILAKVGEVLGEVQLQGEVPEVAKMIERFPEAIEKSLRDFSPHHVANYVYELAQSFNSFYAETKIADSENPNFAYNIALTGAVATTLQKGLALLGIDTVEKM